MSSFVISLLLAYRLNRSCEKEMSSLLHEFHLIDDDRGCHQKCRREMEGGKIERGECGEALSVCGCLSQCQSGKV